MSAEKVFLSLSSKAKQAAEFLAGRKLCFKGSPMCQIFQVFALSCFRSIPIQLAHIPALKMGVISDRC